MHGLIQRQQPCRCLLGPLAILRPGLLRSCVPQHHLPLALGCGGSKAPLRSKADAAYRCLHRNQHVGWESPGNRRWSCMRPPSRLTLHWHHMPTQQTKPALSVVCSAQAAMSSVHSKMAEQLGTSTHAPGDQSASASVCQLAGGAATHSRPRSGLLSHLRSTTLLICLATCYTFTWDSLHLLSFAIWRSPKLPKVLLQVLLACFGCNWTMKQSVKARRPYRPDGPVPTFPECLLCKYRDSNGHMLG